MPHFTKEAVAKFNKYINENLNDPEGEKLREDTYTALYAAVVSGNEDEIRSWLEAGGSANQIVLEKFKGSSPKHKHVSFDRCPLLHVACYLGHVKIVEQLLAKNADVELEGSDSLYGMTPLYVAARRGMAGCIEQLVSKKAIINKTQVKGLEKGLSPLYIAVKKGHYASVEVLLDSGSNPNLPQGQGKHEGRTPLYAAVKAGHDGIVELLFEEGADIFDPQLEDIKAEANEKAIQKLIDIRESVKLYIDNIEKNTRDKRLNMLTPRQVVLLRDNVLQLRDVLFNHWFQIYSLERLCEEISSQFAQTDLSEAAIKSVIDFLGVHPAQAPAAESSSTGKPILHMANREVSTNSDQKAKADDPHDARRPSIVTMVRNW